MARRLDSLEFLINGKPVSIGKLRKPGSRLPLKIPLLDAPLLVRTHNQPATDNKVKIISPQMADQILNDKLETWRAVRDCSPFMTDALVAYEKPGRRLGSTILYEPENGKPVEISTGGFKGEKGIALVVNSLEVRYIDISKKCVRIEVPESRMVPVPDFPKYDGWYMPHETTLPHGVEIEETEKARFLNRLEGSSYVGPLIRGTGSIGDGKRFVAVCWEPGLELGVVVEIPEEDMDQIPSVSQEVDMGFIQQISAKGPAASSEQAPIVHPEMHPVNDIASDDSPIISQDTEECDGQEPTKMLVSAGISTDYLEARRLALEFGGLPPHSLHDDHLVGSDQWKSVGRIFAAWAREFLVYPESGGIFQKDKDVVDWEPDEQRRKWVLPGKYVPEQVIGRRNVGLFIDPRHILEGADTVLLLPETILILYPFIQEAEGRGKVEIETRVPLHVDDEVWDSLPLKERRRFQRTEGVGVRPLFRYYSTIDDLRFSVNAKGRPDNNYSVTIAEPVSDGTADYLPAEAQTGEPMQSIQERRLDAMVRLVQSPKG